MSDASAFDRVEAAQHALIAALDSGDAAAIQSAATAFSDSIHALAGAPVSLDRAQVAARAETVRRLFDQSQMRVNFLTDAVRRRLDQLAAMRGRAPAAVYAREGR
jgi:hypothetical protein